MTLRTGTGKSGNIYRYYSCSTCSRKGKTACKGRSIPVDRLDSLVTNHLVERLLQPDRLAILLSSLAGSRAEKAEAVHKRIAALQQELSVAEEKLKRLYRLIEDGLTEIEDVLRDRLNVLKADRERAVAALDPAKVQAVSFIEIEPALLDEFGRIMRENLTSGTVPFRKGLSPGHCQLDRRRRPPDTDQRL